MVRAVDSVCEKWRAYTEEPPIIRKGDPVMIAAPAEFYDRIEKLEREVASAEVVRLNGENMERLSAFVKDVANRIRALEKRRNRICEGAAKSMDAPCD